MNSKEKLILELIDVSDDVDMYLDYIDPLLHILFNDIIDNKHLKRFGYEYNTLDVTLTAMSMFLDKGRQQTKRVMEISEILKHNQL